jgi:putative RecB family exonuclease
MRTYETCPLRYKFMYVDKIKEPPTPEMEYGAFLHKMLQWLHDPSRGYPSTKEELLDHFKREWYPWGIWDKRAREQAFKDGLDALARYYDKNIPLRDRRVADLERNFAIPVDGNTVTGRIDRIDVLDSGGYEVIDYKTGRRMPGVEHADRDLQLSFYHLAVEHLYQAKEIKLAFYYLLHGQSLETRRGPEGLEYAVRQVTDFAARIEGEEFEPQLGPACERCSYRKRCPMWMFEFREELGIPGTVADDRGEDVPIEEVVTLYAKLNEDAKAASSAMEPLKRMINAYCDEHGVEQLMSGDVTVTRRVRRYESFDPGVLVEVLGREGLLSDYVKLTPTQVEKLLDEGKLSQSDAAALEQAKIVEKETKALHIKRRQTTESADVED